MGGDRAGLWRAGSPTLTRWPIWWLPPGPWGARVTVLSVQIPGSAQRACISGTSDAVVPLGGRVLPHRTCWRVLFICLLASSGSRSRGRVGDQGPAAPWGDKAFLLSCLCPQSLKQGLTHCR